MSYSAIQHPDGRWGVYYKLELLATLGCQQTCDQLIFCLNTRDQKNLKPIARRKRKSVKKEFSKTVF